MANRIEPLAVLEQLFSDELEPHNMLATAFETDWYDDISSDDLAEIALRTIRNYLRDCAAEDDR